MAQIGENNDISTRSIERRRYTVETEMAWMMRVEVDTADITALEQRVDLLTGWLTFMYLTF